VTDEKYEQYAETCRLGLAFTLAIQAAMKRRKMSRADLARRIGCSNAHVTQTLSGAPNVTLATLVKFGRACGMRWKVSAMPAWKGAP